MCRAGQTPAAAAGAYVTSDCRELRAGVGGRLPARPAGSSARFPALGAGPGWGPRSGRGEGAGPRWRGGARPARAPHFGANCSGPGAGFADVTAADALCGCGRWLARRWPRPRAWPAAARRRRWPVSAPGPSGCRRAHGHGMARHCRHRTPRA